MIFALLRYYWQVLKYGKPQPTIEIDPVYGRKELQKNQVWYGMTALAIVGGLAIYVPLAVLNFYVGEKEKEKEKEKVTNQTIYCGFIGFEDLFPPPPPPPKGQLAVGTKVNLFSFHLPLPAPRKELRVEGIAEDQYALDPTSTPAIIDFEQDYLLPEIDSIKEVLEYEVPDDFGFNEKIGSDYHFFTCGCLIEESDNGIGDPPYFLNTLCKNVDSEPEPINLKEVMKVLTYPQIARDAGISGTVVLRVGVDKYGNYTSHKVLKEVHPILLEEVEKEVSKLRFVPAIWKGEPVPFAMNIPFRFELKN